MSAPIVSWWNADNTSQITGWNIGTIDAGTPSPATRMLIWNNRGGEEEVSKMQNCSITTKDSTGGDTGQLVTGTWVEVTVNSMGETVGTPIGGQTVKTIEAGGTNAGAGEILGIVNDGSVANAQDNFADVSLLVNVPSNATAGSIDFLVRVNYQYV